LASDLSGRHHLIAYTDVIIFSPSFTHSVAGATVLIALTGFSWGVTQWAPFSLVSFFSFTLHYITFWAGVRGGFGGLDDLDAAV
jgi:hypothetical protein